MSDRDRAKEALRRHKEQESWARKGPDEVELKGVEVHGPIRLVLRSIYELRGVRYVLRPASTRPRRENAGPDPWALDLSHPPDAPVGSERSEALPNIERHMDCAVCSGEGTLTCTECGGSGTIQHGRRVEVCWRCQGRGTLTCQDCQGSGGVYGSPTAWSRIESSEVARVLEEEELPVPVLLALSVDADGEEGEGKVCGGRLLHAQEGPSITGLTWANAGRSGPRIEEALAAMIADPDLPRAHRLLEQRLEVERVEVFKLTLKGGEVWLFGDPPRAWPPRALESTARAIVRAAPWLFLGGVGVAVAYFVLS